MEKKGKRKKISRRGFLKGAAASAALGAAAPAGAAPRGARRLGPGETECLLSVNGRRFRLRIEPRTTLLRALRDVLGLTGPKELCDRGACGACTVLLDGLPVNACMMLALDAQGRAVTTVEGLAPAGRPSALQRCFVERDALQCGFCTPGMVVTCQALLNRTPRPDPPAIREAISGNICRCGTYGAVVEAVRAASPEDR